MAVNELDTHTVACHMNDPRSGHTEAHVSRQNLLHASAHSAAQEVAV
jgi:hypothetical protein